MNYQFLAPCDNYKNNLDEIVVVWQMASTKTKPYKVHWFTRIVRRTLSVENSKQVCVVGTIRKYLSKWWNVIHPSKECFDLWASDGDKKPLPWDRRTCLNDSCSYTINVGFPDGTYEKWSVFVRRAEINRGDGFVCLDYMEFIDPGKLYKSSIKYGCSKYGT